MSEREADLMAILRVGHNTTLRGSGISMRDALTQSRYRELRPSLEPDDLVPLLRRDAALCKEWLAYSQDKRTTGGWYLLEDGSIGRLEPKVPPRRFESREAAVAAFVVNELDFWAESIHAG